MSEYFIGESMFDSILSHYDAIEGVTDQPVMHAFEQPRHHPLQIMGAEELQPGMQLRQIRAPYDEPEPSGRSVRVEAVGQKLHSLTSTYMPDEYFRTSDSGWIIISRDFHDGSFPGVSRVFESVSLADCAVLPYRNTRGEDNGWNSSNYLRRLKKTEE